MGLLRCRDEDGNGRRGLGRLQAEHEEAGEDEREGHEEKARAGVAGAGFEEADEPGPGKAAEGSGAVDEGHDLGGDILRDDFGDDGEERAVGGVHGSTGEDEGGVGEPEAVRGDEERDHEAEAGEDEEGPDESFALLGAVGEIADRQH